MDPPFRRRHPFAAVLFGIPLLLFGLEFVRLALGFSGSASGLFAWVIGAALVLAVARFGLPLLVGAVSIQRRPPVRAPAGAGALGPRTTAPGRVPGVSAAARAREASARLGAGAYLGVDEYGAWLTADSESAVLVLGPPRSGKTSAVMIPALMASCGPALSTSTKPDVMRATLPARAEIGQAWLFDPAGSENAEDLPAGVRRLCWSPVAAATAWDEALVTARAMTAATNPGAGTTNETHWAERAGALLAPLLYAAHQTGQTITEVLAWTLRQDLAAAQAILADSDTPVAGDVLAGIERTDQRERSSIFSATAGVLAAYNADAARAQASNPNFDPARFTASTDTIYITAPEHKQALCAPLIVGMLEQIRHAAYQHARTHPASGPPMLWALDELANTAPVHDLTALISQAGGQNLQVLAGLQDLSQARARWGEHQADAMLSLFQTKLILPGIHDPRTLEAISLALGEYDRQTVTHTLGHAEPQEWLTRPTHTDTVSYQTQRQRTLTPGEIAHQPPGHALLLQGANWNTLQLTPWHGSEPWRRIAQQ
ncbi:MAG TPA: type IV secretory system conjugative DNA transfer family protein [Solirubrobacteraceae bacterium]|jgi:type IV secretory pathway TraG/TraD family ATPase VirD4|nr:type IV secretory system conjugative DNA transfer family protein [Solirubrobacteraceae bacterium]